MGLIGSYTLQVYCDHPASSNEACTDWPGVFNAHTNGSAKGTAKREGWKFRAGYPASNNPGDPFKGAGYCPNHADDIPSDLREIAT